MHTRQAIFRMKSLLILTFFSSVLGTATLAGFGQPCNETVSCNSTSSLSCNQTQSRCECTSPIDMVYDQDVEKCVLLVGRNCYHRPEFLECTKNAICTEVSVMDDYYQCQCAPGFYKDVLTNKCLPVKGHGYPCSAQVECDNRKMMACLNGSCECFAPDDMEYNAITTDCRIKLGHNCKDHVLSLQYYTGSISKYESKGDEHDHFEMNRKGYLWDEFTKSFNSVQCANGTGCSSTTWLCTSCSAADSSSDCFCPKDKYMNYDVASCVPQKRIGEGCLRSNECSSIEFLTCLGGRCSCNPELYMKNLYRFDISEHFSVAPDICVGKVGASCSVESVWSRYGRGGAHPDNVYCYEDAECENNKCRCKSNLTPTADKMCGRNYNQECSLNNRCANYLVCTNIENSEVMKCRCPSKEYQFHDPEVTVDGCSGSCREHRLIGASCNPETLDACIKNAACLPDEESDFSCKCKPGFVKNSEKHCDIAYGHPCDYKTSEDRCDKKAELDCRIVWKRDSQNQTVLVQICACSNLEDAYYSELKGCFSGTVCQNTTTDGICISDNYQDKGWCKRNVEFHSSNTFLDLIS